MQVPEMAIDEENNEDSGVEPLNMWIYDGF